MAKRKEQKPMYFRSLEVQNVRCFGEIQKLDLTNSDGLLAPWTMMLGDNGVGKTTLLQCLTWMRTVEDPKKRKKKGKVAIKPIMDDLVENTEYERLLRTGTNLKSIVRAQLTNGVNLNNEVPTSDKIIIHGMKLEKIDGDIETIEPFGVYLPEFNEPNLFAYSASRHMAVKNLEKPELHDPVSNMFSESADLYDAEQVLLDLDHNALKEGGSGPNSALLQHLKILLVDLLPDIEDPSCIDIVGRQTITRTEGGVRIHTPYGHVPLSALSLGYKTMLAWAVDLAIRLLRKFPNSTSPLDEPAVVLIDEIDLHLHPKWQRTVRIFLTKHFPKTQFICTAHSPLMAQSSENENLAVLKRTGDEISIINSPSTIDGWRVDQILTSELFGVPDPRSADKESLIEERRKILNKKRKSSKDKARLIELDETISKFRVTEIESDQEALNLIRRTAELIKKENEK